MTGACACAVPAESGPPAGPAGPAALAWPSNPAPPVADTLRRCLLIERNSKVKMIAIPATTRNPSVPGWSKALVDAAASTLTGGHPFPDPREEIIFRLPSIHQ